MRKTLNIDTAYLEAMVNLKVRVLSDGSVAEEQGAVWDLPSLLCALNISNGDLDEDFVEYSPFGTTCKALMRAYVSCL